MGGTSTLRYHMNRAGSSTLLLLVCDKMQRTVLVITPSKVC